MARGGAAKEAANDIGRTELKTVVDNRTVGEILSEARIARDMDYADVAAQLRIRRTYIEAIEDGRLGDLPGSTYAIGFVRTYAELLDLDVPKIVTKFKQEAADFEDRTQLVFPEPMPGSRGPTVSVILIAILMLVGAYGGWLYVSNKDRETVQLVPPLPESLSRLLSESSIGDTPGQAETTAAPEAAPEGQPVSVPLPAPVSEQAVAGAEQPASESPTTGSEAAGSNAEVQPTIVNETIVSGATQTGTEAVQESPASVDATAETTAASVAVETQESAAPATPAAEPRAATSAPAAPAASDTPATAPVVAETLQQQTAVEATEQQQAAAEETELPTVGGSQPAAFGSESAASRIVIRATSPSWVEITAADGKVLLNRLLRTGDTFRVPDQPGIKLVTGSAGGLEFTVDGKIAPKIGDVGDVRRDVLLEPDALLKTQ